MLFRSIVIAFGLLDDRELDEHEANIVIADAKNRVGKLLRYDSLIDPVHMVAE